MTPHEHLASAKEHLKSAETELRSAVASAATDAHPQKVSELTQILSGTVNSTNVIDQWLTANNPKPPANNPA